MGTLQRSQISLVRSLVNKNDTGVVACNHGMIFKNVNATLLLFS
jgi:hypothetical protein